MVDRCTKFDIKIVIFLISFKIIGSLAEKAKVRKWDNYFSRHILSRRLTKLITKKQQDKNFLIFCLTFSHQGKRKYDIVPLTLTPLLL